MIQWGDVPAWFAVVISILGGLYSWRTRRSHDEAVKRFQSQEESLQQQAQNGAKAEQDLAMLVEQIAELTKDRASQEDPASKTAPVSVPHQLAQRLAFNIEFVGGHAYRLRNTSTVNATNVVVTAEGGIGANMPDGIELRAGRSSDPFVIQGTMASAAPGEVDVTCDELDEAVTLPLP